MKSIAICVTAALMTISVSPVLAAESAPAATAAKFTTAETPLGTLLDSADAKAVLDKYIHEMISNPQIDMARSMTLKQLQGFAGDALSDATLAQIDVDLAKIPAK